jgi:predicted nucleotidyltransferase
MTAPIAHPNLVRLASAAKKLEPLLDQVVFVGGCVTELLVTDPAAAPVRPTLDVDAIVEIASYAELAALEERLRELGFQHSSKEADPICRWLHAELILDLMPTDSSIFGFTNLWYGPALNKATQSQIGDLLIRVITAPYFVATKLEAFHGRGKNDFRMSHDLEDIIAVIDGRAELVAETRTAEINLREYLRGEFRNLLASRNFLDAIPGYLLPDTASQQRIGLVIRRMRELTEA